MTEKLSDISPYLYHYTNEQGLKGILENRCLWATHYKFLNDTSEIEHFLDTFLPAFLESNQIKLDSVKAKNPIFKDLLANEAEVVRFHELWNQGFIQKTKNLLIDEVYLASFCKENKDPYINNNGILSQWRGYGGNGGYAIVLNLCRLQEMLKFESEAFSYHLLEVHPVAYSGEEDKFKSEMSKELETIVHYRQGIIDMTMQENSVLSNDEIGVKGLIALYKCMVILKHRGFKEEHEARIIALPFQPEFANPNSGTIVNKGRHLKDKNGTLVPYIELFRSLNQPLPIEKIIVGPHKDKELRAAALRIMLRNTIKVTVSEIPYIN